jgi:hypothetical protein
MKLYKNQSANYPCYFVRTGQLNAEPFESGESLSTGYMIELCSEEWQCRKVKCYDSFLNSNFDCIAEKEESESDFIKSAFINLVLSLISDSKREKKEEGLKSAQSCILTWLSCYPAKLPQLKRIIIPEDFSTSLYQEVASIMYRQIEQGKMNLNELLKNFVEDENQYQEVVKIFANKQEISESEKAKGIRECVIRVKRYSLQKEADTTDDIKRLQEVMEALKGLDHLNISF